MKNSLHAGVSLAVLTISAATSLAASAAGAGTLEWVSGEKTFACLTMEAAQRFVREPDLLEPVPSKGWLAARGCVHYQPGIRIEVVEGHDSRHFTRPMRELEVWKIVVHRNDGSSLGIAFLPGAGAEIAPESRTLPARVEVVPAMAESKEAALQSLGRIAMAGKISLAGTKASAVEISADRGRWMLVIDGLNLGDAINLCEGIVGSPATARECRPSPL